MVIMTTLTDQLDAVSRLADKLWQDVDPKDFACKPEIRVPQSVVFSQPGANVTLSCFIIGTPMPDAKWVLKVSFLFESILTKSRLGCYSATA